MTPTPRRAILAAAGMAAERTMAGFGWTMLVALLIGAGAAAAQPQPQMLRSSGRTIATLDPVGPEQVGKPEIRLTVSSFAEVSAADHPVDRSQRVIGFSGIAINDNALHPQTVYGIYGEARRIRGTGAAQASEFNALNGGPAVDLDPYNPFGAVSAASWLSCGRRDLPAFPGACTAALAVVDNGAHFRRGIVFRAGALDPGGSLDALAMAGGFRLSWYGSADGKIADVAAAASGGGGRIALAARDVRGRRLEVALDGAGASLAPVGTVDLGTPRQRWRTVNAERLAIAPATPASSHDACTVGQIWADGAYVYVCAAPNRIRRAALNDF